MQKDITNQKFGTLTALYPLNERKHKCIVWQCRCDCGKCIKVNSTDLLRHRRTTCGDGEHRKTVVIGERRGHLTLLRDTGLRDSKGERVYEWRCDCGTIFCRNLIGTLRTGTPHLCPECQKRIKAVQAAEARDKIDRDPATGLSRTALQNIQNGVPTKRNTSGVRGVYWHEAKNKWIATGRIGGKLRELGLFDSLDEAREERELFVEKYYYVQALSTASD